MPEISRFLGIKIFIYYNDHNPPHFHAHYENHKASFSIKDLRLMEGKLPQQIEIKVVGWAYLHREELMEDWELAGKDAPLKKIKGLL